MAYANVLEVKDGYHRQRVMKKRHADGPIRVGTK